MTEKDVAVAMRASDLRDAFDRSFAEPPHEVTDEIEKLLGLHVGEDEYAVRLSEISGLLPEQTIVPLPSPAPELLGIVGVRGAIVPVYSLGALLGHGPTSSSLGWIMLVGADVPIGLAFEEFKGHLRVPRSEISVAGDGASQSYVHETVRVSDTLRGIISVKSVVLALTQRLGTAGSIKET